MACQFSTEQDMASHLCSTGSLSIIVSTEGWDGYKGGIMSASTCGSKVDHAVLLVGELRFVSFFQLGVGVALLAII